MMCILVCKSTTRKLRKSISTSLVNQQLTWGGVNLDSNTTFFLSCTNNRIGLVLSCFLGVNKIEGVKEENG